MEAFDLSQELLDLLPREYGGQTSFPRSFSQGEEMPFPFKDVLEEKFDAGIADTHGGRRPQRDLLAMNEVFEQFIFGNKFRGLVVMDN